ncbi:MAG: prepilin-type N-terminal cleavage/methylation domain-containing protein, partial [Verrucomicrobia bacterium]|nr:prepilin-type N-terminal cleavage/methylation domain-containing protein [Verrucomicrobiota bacterium]
MNHRSGREAFTLVEFLAVVAILAILAGLLLPAFVNLRARARQLHGLANTRQIVRAVLLLAAQ